MKSISCVLLCLLMGTMLAYGQVTPKKKFNLDFNTYDTIKRKAEGWFEKGFFKPVGMEQVSENNYAGKVVSDSRGKFGWVFNKIPVRYQGDSVKLTGSVKTKNVRKGFAGLIMRVDGVNNAVAFENSSSKQISGTNDWMRYSITLPLIKNAHHIFVGGILEGKGTAWFDDFEVFIDGKNIEDLEEVTSELIFLQKIAPEVKNVLRDIKGELELDADGHSVKGLKPLIDHVGNKKIVSIGEDTHGTSEFYRLRAELTKTLIRDKGFKTLVLENPYDDIELLSEQLNSGTLEELMKNHLFSIYQTAEMKEFLNWLKQEGTNLSIKIKGCDDSYWVIHQLIDREIRSIADAKLDGLNMVFQNLTQTNTPSSQKKEYKRGVKIYESLLVMDAYMYQQDLHTVMTKELFMNAKSSYYNYDQVTKGKPIKSRDETMADRITFLAEHSDDKIIVWAHNAHISNEVLINNEIGLMGKNLKEKFGSDYFTIGLSSLNGTYSYMDNNFINDDHSYNDVLKLGTLSFQPKLSWEAILGAASDIPFFVISKDFNNRFDGEAVFGKGKLLGYTKESKEDYYDLALFSTFDGLIFVKNTTATTHIKLE